MSNEPYELIRIEEALAGKIASAYAPFVESRLAQIAHKCTAGDFSGAYAIIDGFNLMGLVSDHREEFEKIGMQALLFGASEAVDLKDTALVNGKGIPIPFYAAIDQLILMIETNAADKIRNDLREVVQDAEGREQVAKGDVENEARDAHGEWTSQTNTPEFKAWFGNSQVVDEHGKPLVVYHGTKTEFDTFDPKRFGQTDEGWAGAGFYFSTDKTVAPAYGKIIVPVYLSADKLYDFAGQNFYTVVKDHGGPVEFSKWLRANGYAGSKLWSQIMVLDPTQIKSATRNSGKFDSKNADITKDDLSEDELIEHGGMLEPQQVEAPAKKRRKRRRRKSDVSEEPRDATGKWTRVYHGTTAQFDELKAPGG